MINILNSSIITADSSRKTDKGWLLSGRQVSIALPTAPKRYLYSGWQSWSLTAWVDTERPMRPSRPRSLRPMQTDPAYGRETRPHGSWYGAVELSGGQVIFLGALGFESHVRLDGKSLTGWFEAGDGEWFLASGEEDQIFNAYAGLLKDRYGAGRIEKPPRVWCSWYSLYNEIREENLRKILGDLGDMPFEVFQVDGGWETDIGDWEPNGKFPSGMADLANRIKVTGRKAGLWLAPLLVTHTAKLFQDHPDWLLHDEQGRLVSAGFNWGKKLYGLDTTHPEALDWLASLMKKVRTWGFEYAKLDFLYAGALPGKRHLDMPREAAYRNGLKVIREALGEAYFLTCGAPILPSLGLCDGLRIGPDVAAYWVNKRDDVYFMNHAIPGTRNAIRTTLQHLWLKPLVNTDPDVTFFRSIDNNFNLIQKGLLQDLALIAGFKASSDIPAWMAESEITSLREFLERQPRVVKKARAIYELDDRVVDFNPHITLPAMPGPIDDLIGACLGSLADVPVVMATFDAIGKRFTQKALKKHPV